MKPSSILVVDDEPDITSLLDSLLTQEGYRVETASNGEEGIQHFRAMGPDLVITDIRMPIKSGLELLKTVREESNDVEVIILTGHGDQSTVLVRKVISTGKLNSAEFLDDRFVVRLKYSQ